MSAAQAFLPIGEVLARLREEFPDVSISKIRFLEAEGLVEPARTSSGYRQFSREDVSRLRYVLRAQRDHYLPLRVIKSHLDALDRGLEPGPAGASPSVPAAVLSEQLPGPEAFAREAGDVRLSRRELEAAAGLTPQQLQQLEQYGLLAPRTPEAYFGAEDLVIAGAVAAMARYGIEARHLRPFKTAADREVGLVEQVVIPLVRGRDPDGRGRAEEAARDLAALSVRLHAALVKAGLAPLLSS